MRKRISPSAGGSLARSGSSGRPGTRVRQKPSTAASQPRKQKSPNEFEYDVCVSFAGESRAVVREVVSSLKRRRVTCFYDYDEQADLLGKDLFTYLDEVYRKKARYCVMFISKHYPLKQWTNHERRSIQARMFASKDEYLIPVRLDDAEVPGVLSTLGYIDGRHHHPSAIAALIQQKVRGKRAIKKRKTKATPVNSGRRVTWTYVTNLRKLRKAVTDPFVLSLLDLTAARSGELVPLSDVLKRAGVKDARRAMVSLGLLTKTIKREFNLPAEKVTWPVERHHVEGSGKTSYRMSPDVALAWLKSA